MRVVARHITSRPRRGYLLLSLSSPTCTTGGILLVRRCCADKVKDVCVGVLTVTSFVKVAFWHTHTVTRLTVVVVLAFQAQLKLAPQAIFDGFLFVGVASLVGLTRPPLPFFPLGTLDFDMGDPRQS
jgi:hypothetical protein